MQAYKADIETISKGSKRLVLQLRHKAGGAEHAFQRMPGPEVKIGNAQIRIRLDYLPHDWTSGLSNFWQRLRRRRWPRAGGAIAALVLAIGIATACSNGGDGETSAIETTPTTPTPPSSIATPLTLATSGQIAFVSNRDGDSENT